MTSIKGVSTSLADLGNLLQELHKILKDHMATTTGSLKALHDKVNDLQAILHPEDIVPTIDKTVTEVTPLVESAAEVALTAEELSHG